MICNFVDFKRTKPKTPIIKSTSAILTTTDMYEDCNRRFEKNQKKLSLVNTDFKALQDTNI